MAQALAKGLSLIEGGPIEDEPGMGALTIASYLEEVVGRYSGREAVVLNGGGERIVWSYDDLLARAQEVARALIASGLGKGERVGILMTNRPEFLSSLFGTALAGGVAVALSTFSTPEELDHLISASDISILLFEERVLKKDFRAMLAAAEPALLGGRAGALESARYPFLSRVVALGGVPGDPHEPVAEGAIETWEAFLAGGKDVPLELVKERASRVVPSDPGGIFFSSGTTSLPKGIAHDQRAFAIQWWRWPRIFCMSEPVRSWTGNGFFWSGNISMVAGTALSTGGTVVLQRYFDAEEALRLMEAERVSFANGRPHQWARLQAAEGWAGADLSSLKYIPRGELIWEHPTVDTDWTVPMSFGTTETMTIVTAMTADTPVEDYKGSFGKVLPGNMLKIVDPETRELRPLGEHGEMCVKGPTLMSGYLGKAPEDCFDAEGYYCTGDGGRVDAEGRFYWDGRLTSMIKTKGANVSPEEVDDVIGNYPGVKRTQTVGVPDDLLGEMVVACIVPLDGESIDEGALEAHLKERLASFKVPRRYLIMTEEEFSITGNEKIKAADVKAAAIRKLEAETA